ncbi:MAG: hypothetical protein GF353_16480 [Candidatus Lokiarchaeota archaeon]|nr:hypothetical protein [Candidatus Lokiarchaeota archaeon]
MSSIPSLLKHKDYITLIGTTLGVIALICAVLGTRTFVSVGFFLISLTLGTDLLDGFIARKTGTVNKIGIELDSLSDSLTFGIAPSILIFQAFKRGTPYDIFLIIGCACFVYGAILRLARFNITVEEEPGYKGVPTPLSCLMVITFFYANYFYVLASGDPTYPFIDISYYAVPVIMILIGWFNITTYIQFKEKGKGVYILFLVFAPLSPIFGIVGLLLTNFAVLIFVSFFFLIAFFFLIGYVIVGFVINARNKN